MITKKTFVFFINLFSLIFRKWYLNCLDFF
jgi:hypothetical protein